MTLRTVDAYGAPSFGARPGTEGIVFHTPENPDISLASAIAIAKWQGTAANTSRGSYHGIIAHDGADSPATCRTESHWVMVRSVPWNLAAGSLTTNRDPSVWAPGRHPWIKGTLSAAAYADPNAYLQAIAISGRTAWLVANGYAPALVTVLARWVRTLEAAYKYDALLTEHRQWQLNRSDPGAGLAQKVLDRYTALFLQPAPEPAPTPTPTPTPPAPTELELARRSIAALERRLGEKNTALDTAITALQAARAR